MAEPRHYEIAGPLRKGASYRVGVFTPGEMISAQMLRDLIAVLQLTADTIEEDEAADQRRGDMEIASWAPTPNPVRSDG